MKFGNFDNYRHDLDDGPDVPDGYIREDEAFDYVFENERDAVIERVRSDAAGEWLRNGQSWLDLLNIVSRHDKEQLRQAIRGGVISKSKRDEVAEAQIFAVAGDAARFLESIGSPHAKSCNSSEDLGWSRKLVSITRAFREVLFLISEPDQSWMVEYHLAAPLKEINSALMQGRTRELIWHGGSANKKSIFERSINPEFTPLCSDLAEWICEFLARHSDSIGLSVCTECGTIFIRGRRDNVYCSKACQNRVAYKRRKIFEAGVLVEVKVDAEAPSAIAPGLWLNHSRLGLGRIEAVRFTDRTLWLQFEGHGYGQHIPDSLTAEEQLAAVQKSLKHKLVRWEEVVDPRSLELRVRFLQISRSFRAWEIFPRQGKPYSSPTFHRVTDAVTLADLL